MTYTSFLVSFPYNIAVTYFFVLAFGEIGLAREGFHSSDPVCILPLMDFVL